MSKIRVLVVDDAVVIRRMMTDTLAACPEIEVVGTAANGKIALQRVAELKPDLMTLDVEMPEMDGLETLRNLRRTHPALPVIMFSTLTERGAKTTIEALTLGATDYVTKPSNVGSISGAIQRLREDLVPKIKALFENEPRRVRRRTEPQPARTAPVPAAEHPRPAPRRVEPGIVDVVAIGISTGGPNALAAVIPSLPRELPVAVLIVQHMPPLFTRLLAERLASKAKIPIKEAQNGQVVTPGYAWIAPGDHHLVVVKRDRDAVLTLTKDPPENSCRPSADVLFRSVASVYGARALGVVMTGMGSDGLHGCEALRKDGAQVIVQDEATSVIWGMPGIVATSGLADEILPLEQIAGAIVSRAFHGRIQQPARPGSSPATGDQP